MASNVVPSGETSTGLVLTRVSASVLNGGSALDTRINSGGALIVSSGGEAYDTTVNSSGKMIVNYKGYANGVVVSKGANLTIASDGSALAVKEEGGLVSWSSGAFVTFVPSVFTNYSYQTATAAIHSGTTAISTTLNRSVDFYVYHGGLASETRINSAGSLHIYSGGEALDTFVNNGGKMYVYYKGLADGVVVSQGATLSIASDGSALAIKEEGGYVTWSSGAVVTFVPSVFTNYSYLTATAAIHSGTTAVSTTLNRSVDFYVYKGGLASETRINSAGSLHIYSGGEARDTFVNNGGKMYVYSGGFFNGGTVSSGGVLTVSSGGLITGRMTIINGAKVSASAGAIIDFDLTRTAPGDSALVSNLSLINGAPVFTLTASGDLDTGDYVLAGGASGFNKYITVYDSETVFSYGMFTVGESVRVGNLSYTLYLSGSDLAVSVVEVPPDYVPPTVTNIKASSVVPTNQNVVVTATFADDVALASALYKIGADGEWTPYKNGVTVTSNTTVYFLAIDAAGNESKIASHKVDNIDKTAPAAPTASANITETTTGSVTVSAVFSTDSVLREYSFDRIEWKNYTNGITFNSNGRVYFRGTDEAGNISDITSYAVSNIEEVEKDPDLGFYWPDSWYSDVMVAPSTDSSLGTAQTLLDHKYLYLNFATANWGDLPSDPYCVDIYLDGDYYRSISRDSLGGRYYKATEDINIGSFSIGTHDVELRIVTDGYDGDLTDNVYGTTFSVQQDETGSFREDCYGGSSQLLDCGDTMRLKTGKYVINGNFIGTETGKKVNAKIVIYDSLNKKVGTVSIKKGKIAYKEFILSNDTYTFQLLSTDKQKTADRVTFAIVGDVFYKADLNDNSIDAVKDRYPFVATVQDVPRSLVSAGWVGFGDVLSFRQVDFEYAGKYTFTAKTSDKVKISLVAVTVDSKGRSKEKTVVSTTVSGKKIGKNVDFGGILLNSGTYYLRVEALSAAKGTNADFSVEIKASSTIFSACDDGTNGWLYDSKTKTLNKSVANSKALDFTPYTKEILLDGDAIREDWSGFVGYGDTADYMKIHLSGFSTLSFNVSTTGSVKFIVYSLSSGKKAGTYNMKSIQSTIFKSGKGQTAVSGRTKAISLSEGDYFLCMESTDAKKGGCAYYNIEVNQEISEFTESVPESALAMPESAGALPDSFSQGLSGVSGEGFLASL